MEQEASSRVELIMAGLGGMGVLTAGQLLSWAALQRYKNVSWVPSYDTSRRGGLCECTVIFSDEEITSPLLDQAQTVMLFDGSQLKTLEPRVRPGGVMIVESAGLTDSQKREDFRLVPVSGLEVAVGMGDSLLNNLVLLGVYAEVVKAISADLIEEELERRYGSKESVLKRNREAFRQGLKLAKTIKR
jgi:2-oxoglutarate ferredoxin oxidoreductase subunit gamma